MTQNLTTNKCCKKLQPELLVFSRKIQTKENTQLTTSSELMTRAQRENPPEYYVNNNSKINYTSIAAIKTDTDRVNNLRLGANNNTKFIKCNTEEKSVTQPKRILDEDEFNIGKKYAAHPLNPSHSNKLGLISHRKRKCNNKNTKFYQKQLLQYLHLTAETFATARQLLNKIENGAYNMFRSTSTKSSSKSSTKSTTTTNRTIRKSRTTNFRLLPSIGTTSFFTLFTLLCLETVLLSTMSSCAKTFYMHWNTSNSIFRIDNTDHIIDVNKGNLAFEFDQVHIICPVYEPGTFENETEKYIIYNVSKVEYETCRITNADPRVIAICDKPQKLMFFTITFRPFTPQPGGLEFLPGNDYYFISTSSKDDLYRRIGGRCSTNNMKVVFKVCCAPDEKNKTHSSGTAGSNENNDSGLGTDNNRGGGDHHVEIINTDIHSPNQQHNNINSFGINSVNSGLIPVSGMNENNGGNVHIKSSNGQNIGTSINTNVDQFNRIPIQTNGINVIGNNLGNVGPGQHGVGGIMLTPGHNGISLMPTNSGGNGLGSYAGQYPIQTGIRINNMPSHHPGRKSNNNHDDIHYDKHPNEVVKNEELTYNSGAGSLYQHCSSWKYINIFPYVTNIFTSILKIFTGDSFIIKNAIDINNVVLNFRNTLNFRNFFMKHNLIIPISLLLIVITNCTFKYTLGALKLSSYISPSATENNNNKTNNKLYKPQSSYIPVKKNFNETCAENFR